MIWVSNTSRVCFESGGPHVGKACFELWLPYTYGWLKPLSANVISMEVWGSDIWVHWT